MALLRSNQFGNADQVVGDQVKQEIGGDVTYAAMLGLAHGSVLLAPPEDAFGHGTACLRHAVAVVSGGSSVDGATSAPPGVLIFSVPRRPVRSAAYTFSVSGIIADFVQIRILLDTQGSFPPIGECQRGLQHSGRYHGVSRGTG